MNARPTPETDSEEIIITKGKPTHWVSQDFARKLERERDEALEYADKLAEGLPEGMLPKDIEVLREANLGLATELAAVTEQRDRLAEALQKLADCDWVITLPDRMDAVRAVANQALQPLTQKP